MKSTIQTHQYLYFYCTAKDFSALFCAHDYFLKWVSVHKADMLRLIRLGNKGISFSFDPFCVLRTIGFDHISKYGCSIYKHLLLSNKSIHGHCSPLICSAHLVSIKDITQHSSMRQQ